MEHRSRFMVFNGSLDLIVASILPSVKFRNVVEFEAACVEFREWSSVSSTHGRKHSGTS